MENIEKVIRKYKLKPHPEGGFYREIYRSEQVVNSPINNNERNALTHIYFLLVKGQVSRFHKVLHDEVWNFYDGAPLTIIEFDGKDINEVILGNDSFVKVIKGGIYQAAETTGDFSLVGCSVSPGFDFKDFSFLKDDVNMSEFFLQTFVEYKKYL